jgi:hypothetical protein
MIPQGYSPSLSYVLWLVYFISQDGQTGSGKTFTMGSSDVPPPGGDSAPAALNQGGVIPRVLSDLFAAADNIQAEHSSTDFHFRVSYLEIYNEEVW